MESPLLIIGRGGRIRTGDPEISTSRHSVGHGVVDPAKLSSKAAVIAVLVVHQLFYFCGPTDVPNETPETEVQPDGG